jgi:hypothetical protein
VTSGTSSLDIRLPIGGLFTLLGLLIGGYGIGTAGSDGHYERSMGVNINLWWGLVMLVFGVLLLAFASRSRRGSGVHAADASPEGQATERRERRLGLED